MPPMLGATSNEPMSRRYETSPGPVGTRFCEIRKFQTVDSTNRYLVDEASAGAPDGLVAVADHQSAGRGRLGRRWEAPEGTNLLASVLLRPNLEVSELHLLTLLMALAASDACMTLAEVEPQLKWPNDLLLGSRKLAGILAESVPVSGAQEGPGEEEQRRAVVVGLGLNVGWPAPEEQETQSEIEHTATSLSRESATRGHQTKLEPRTVLYSVLEGLEGRLRDLVSEGGHERQMSEYRRRCVTLGREVRVSVGEEIFLGTAIDLTSEGHLLLRTASGVLTVTAGDVVHLDQSFK